MKVLIVEDEATVAQLLRQTFEFDGHHCQTASSADAATMALAANNYDLITLDHMMPGQMGLEWIREMALEQPGIVARVIVITGVDLKSEDLDWLKKNGIPIIRKPYDISELRQAVEFFQDAPH